VIVAILRRFLGRFCRGSLVAHMGTSPQAAGRSLRWVDCPGTVWSVRAGVAIDTGALDAPKSPATHA
jgi:hypothetical protein